MSGTVLVFGASGYIGSHLVPYLYAQGERVRAVSRHPKALAGRGWEGVEIMAADALQPDTLDAALSGVEVAYYLVHSMAAGSHFAQLDLQAAANFRDAAARCGVRRIVYLGGLIPPDPSSLHLQSRQETGELLRQGSVPVTEIRAGMIIGPGSAAFEVIRDLVQHLPVIFTPRWVTSRSPPIGLDDVLAYLTGVARLPAAAGQVFDVAGPEVMSYAQVMRRFGAMVGRRPVILPLPLLSPELSAWGLPLVTTVPGNIARALIGGLKHDVLADDRPIRQLLPIPLQRFEAQVEAVFAAERAMGVVDRWREGALDCRGGNAKHAFYARRMQAQLNTPASVQSLWQVLNTLSRQEGYGLDGLWRLRGAVDRLLGGPGRRFTRTRPGPLQVGERFDCWEVLASVPGERLTLRSLLRSPGAGIMEFTVADRGGHRELELALYFHPAGCWGLLYWYALSLPHRLILAAMPRHLAARALSLEAPDGLSPSPHQ